MLELFLGGEWSCLSERWLVDKTRGHKKAGESPVIIYYGMPGRENIPRIESLRGEHILESFYYPLAPKWREFFAGIFLDSGAYTAWKSGERIDPIAYLDYALAHPYAAVATDLSVDATPDETWRISEKFKAQGLSVVPGFHQGEELHLLDDYVREFGRVGLGCSEETPGSETVRRWLQSCFERLIDAEGYPTVPVHGYRLVQYIDQFPFSSVDSTTWSKSGGDVSHSTLSQKFPWLRPDEIGELIIKFYNRRPRCTRLEVTAPTFQLDWA